MNINLIPSASKGFAHLMGRGNIVAKKAKAEDEKEEKEDEKEDKKDAKAEDERTPPKDDKEDGKKGSKAKKAGDEEEESDPCMEEDAEGEEDDKKEKKDAKKKASAEGFDKATLARARSIFASEHAAGRADMAAHLAFDTELSADSAIAAMKYAGPVAAKSPRSLGEKMQDVKNPSVGVDAPNAGNEASTLAARIVAAGERATGK